MDAYFKTPLWKNINQTADAATRDALAYSGRVLPCSVVEVISSGIVKVNFDVNGKPFTLPQITMPILGSQYIRYPIQTNDKGLAVAADAFLGGQSGLGANNPLVWLQPPNLAALSFLWLGNTQWSEPDDSQAVVLYGPNGVVSRDTESSAVSAVGVGTVEHDAPVVQTSGNVVSGTGATGMFTTFTGQTVTVQDGIITNIY